MQTEELYSLYLFRCSLRLGRSAKGILSDRGSSGKTSFAPSRGNGRWPDRDTVQLLLNLSTGLSSVLVRHLTCQFSLVPSKSVWNLAYRRDGLWRIVSLVPVQRVLKTRCGRRSKFFNLIILIKVTSHKNFLFALYVLYKIVPQDYTSETSYHQCDMYPIKKINTF